MDCRLSVYGLLMSSTHACEVEDVSNPFASRRAVVRDVESGFALLGFPPDTQLNTQWRAIPRKTTGMNESHKVEHELTVHQPKSSGPTSHEKTKLMFMSISMLMLLMLMPSSMSMSDSFSSSRFPFPPSGLESAIRGLMVKVCVSIFSVPGA